MEESSISKKNINRILIFLYVGVIAFAVYNIITAIGPYNTTGILKVYASVSNAQLSISQEDHRAIDIGTGSARIRLMPGTYQVAAISGNLRTTAVVTISNKQTTNLSLNLNQSSKIRTMADINFEGTDALLNVGLSSAQVNAIEEYLFQYQPNASAISIDGSSVTPGPHDPNSVSPFTDTFIVNFDTTAYKASVSYTDTNNVNLTLYNLQNGAAVYASQATTSSGGD